MENHKIRRIYTNIFTMSKKLQGILRKGESQWKMNIKVDR